MKRKTHKDLTREDCEQFKRKHPEITRANIHQKKGYVRAMKRLGIFDELYPYEKKRSFDLTREDCEQFKQEHPDMKRTELRFHHNRYHTAMQRLGILDELFPDSKNRPDKLTREDCEQFKREHPVMNADQLRIHHTAYFKAMKRLGILKTLYPPARLKAYDKDYLIERASHYNDRGELMDHEPRILHAITTRGKAFIDEALGHMEPRGNKIRRMIYAFEFNDRSAYVGLTYNADKREKQHMRDCTSAVLKHIKATGIEPVFKPLTGFLPVKEAQRMEGEWLERYKQEGWTMLNVATTGGIGGCRRNNIQPQVVELAKQGMMPKEIPNHVECSYDTVIHILSQAGLSYRGMSNMPIEILDDDGSVIGSFKSIKDAGIAYGTHPSNIAANIRRGYRTHGHYHRHNPEAYRLKYGKEPPENEGMPKKPQS
jgi:hypothetical protein